MTLGTCAEFSDLFFDQGLPEIETLKLRVYKVAFKVTFDMNVGHFH